MWLLPQRRGVGRGGLSAYRIGSLTLGQRFTSLQDSSKRSLTRSLSGLGYHGSNIVVIHQSCTANITDTTDTTLSSTCLGASSASCCVLSAA
ncbi:hypothetical protein SCLCIDRAFT_1212963 [Scleroderma citrinum Foug A]|uniref:Uncharacterized protein n=1 Tax=Scleroderma citrinum Foug A TaxID=1036808 RepID=A0A0C2ZTM3_9AGAM|nr:hypothetical protein SCLCIDRAFT_1212963 [Scleroderma citrinum Foug A]